MLALTLGQAKAIGAAVVVVLLVGAIVSAWLMKTIAQKLVIALVLAGLAALVWTQRSSLQDCADDVKRSGLAGETTCTFFGTDVTISAGGSSSPPAP